MTDKLRIRHVPPADLIPHPRNEDVRDISLANLDRLRRIIDRFGFVEPLVVSAASGYLLGGHQRRAIAIEDGITSIPIVEIPDLGPDEEATLLVALNNQEAQGVFNLGGLTDLLAPIEDTPLLEASGFDFDQWQSLQLAAADERLKAGREGDTPPLAKKGTTTRTQPGDVWRLGVHTLVVGDACIPDAYLQITADMCFTDPPYGIAYDGGGANTGRRSITREHHDFVNDETDPDKYYDFLLAALTQIRDHNRGGLYLCHAITQSIAVYSAWYAAGYIHNGTITCRDVLDAVEAKATRRSS